MTGFLTHRVGDTVFKLAKWDQVTNHIAQFGLFEPETLGYVERHVQPMTTFVDGGSYNGIYSFVAQLKGARPVSFEPHPGNFELIWENMKANSIFFEVNKVALSDKDVDAKFYYNAAARSTSAGSLEPSPRKKSFRVVQCRRLDSFPLENVSMVKLDIERHEPKALEGAKGTILRFQPTLIVELLDAEATRRVGAILTHLEYEEGPLLDRVNRVYVPRKRK